MTTSTLEGEEYLPFDSIFFDDQIDRVIDDILPQFNRMIKKYLLFHLFFIAAVVIELALSFYFLTDLVHSSLLAFSLSFIFLTLFSYFILRIYLQTKKPAHFQGIKDRFLNECKELLGFRNDVPEHHLALANACTKFAMILNGKEQTYYRLPRWLDFVGATMEGFSCWCHWHDVHHMRELLFLSAVEEHLILVKLEPTDLEVHAALANAYVMLSSLYNNPNRQDHYDEERWFISERFQKILEGKFRATAERAIEEFKILNDFAPDDPWVRMQLAYSYQDLGMPEEEIQEYEALLRLCPDDKDILYKLGVLFFQQGQNAAGLQIYDELKSSNYKKAEQLIEHYGDYNTIAMYEGQDAKMV